MQIGQVMTSYIQPDFVQNISANLYQKCLILCNKILLNVLFNTSLTVLLPWQHTGFQTSPYLKLFWLPLPFHFDISWQHFICMIQQACRYVSSRLWPCLHFPSWKSLSYWNQVDGDWRRVSCHGEGIFYSLRCFFCKTISLPSFNVLHCKLAKRAPFICLI